MVLHSAMPKINISEEVRNLIDSQPERKEPLLLARDRVGMLLIKEAAKARATKTPRKK